MYEKEIAAAIAMSVDEEQWEPFMTANEMSYEEQIQQSQREFEAEFGWDEQSDEEGVKGVSSAAVPPPPDSWPSISATLPRPMMCSQIPSAPTPPEPVIQSLFDTYTVKKGELEKKQAEITKSIAAKQAEIYTEETKPATFSSKWSARAANGSGAKEDALKKLRTELGQLTAAEKLVQDQMLDLKKKNESYIRYIEGHQKLVAMYEKYLKDTYAGWNKVYGKHTPINSLSDVFARYNVKEEKTEGGLTRIVLENEDKIGQAVREMQLGLGPSRALRQGWSTIQVLF